MSFILPSDRYYHDDYNELLRYFGPSFHLGDCNSSDDKIGQDRQNYADDDDFNRRTYTYCYQSIAIAVAGIHRPYIAKILEHTADSGPNSIIDVGSGGGQVGLALHTLGYNVSFADLYSESAKFLAWRLAERRINRPLYLLDIRGVDIPVHDIAICFDVIEHLAPEGQHNLIHRCAELGRTVFMNLIHDERKIMNGVHYMVDTESLTEYIADSWPIWYQDYYPDGNGNFRQRLVVYGNGIQENQ